jgi:hypothetical protein
MMQKRILNTGERNKSWRKLDKIEIHNLQSSTEITME